MVESLRPMRTGTTTVVEMLGDLGPARPAARGGPGDAAAGLLGGRDPGLPQDPRGRVDAAGAGGAARAQRLCTRRRSVSSTPWTSHWWVSAPAKWSRRCRRGTTSSPLDAAARRPRCRCRRADLPAVPRRPGRARRDATWTTSSPASRWTSCKSAKRRWIVAGGPSKYAAIRAAAGRRLGRHVRDGRRHRTLVVVAGCSRGVLIPARPLRHIGGEGVRWCGRTRCAW